MSPHKLRHFGSLVIAALIFGNSALSAEASKGAQQRLTSAQHDAVQALFDTPKRFAILVGINRFDDPSWSTLKFPVKDANDMASVLNDTRYGRFDRVITLTSPEETTKDNILAMIRKMAQLNISKDDTVVFYISTHGTLAHTDEGRLQQYLVARDTRFDDIAHTGIDVSMLKRELAQIRSQKKVMVFAACHSGNGKSQLGKDLIAELGALKAPFFVKPIETVSEATIVLAASAWGETAREDVSLENDVYTHFFVEGIKKGDRNGDGAVTVTEAHDYAKQQTYYITKGEQRPSMESIITGVDPVILSGEVVRSGKPVIFDYSQRYEKMIVFVDGEKKGSLPLGVAVEPGEHQIELRTPDGLRPLYYQEFNAREGEQISLPLLIHGYDQGASFRIGYQGFLDDKVDSSIAKPMLMYGAAYSSHAYFSPRLGYRLDLSYGSEQQTLTVDQTLVKADVSQTAVGAALLFRTDNNGLALYGGPRIGALQIGRNLAVDKVGGEKNTMPTVGVIGGIHFRYKQKMSFAAEANVNYANIEVGNASIDSLYYSLLGNFSLNF